jgi:hypothetical protein
VGAQERNKDPESKIETQCSSDAEECVDEKDSGDLRVDGEMSRLAGFATAGEVRAIVERSTAWLNE